MRSNEQNMISLFFHGHVVVDAMFPFVNPVLVNLFAFDVCIVTHLLNDAVSNRMIA